MTQDEAYKAWWHNEGSGIIPLPNEDMEEFAHRMTQIAWSNGAFKECEACAKLCAEDGVQAMEFTGGTFVGGYFAKRIMERNKHGAVSDQQV